MSDASDLTFRIRLTAHRRRRTSANPLPQRVIVREDGSAIVAYGGDEAFTRYESIDRFLADHELTMIDLEPEG